VLVEVVDVVVVDVVVVRVVVVPVVVLPVNAAPIIACSGAVALLSFDALTSYMPPPLSSDSSGMV